MNTNGSEPKFKDMAGQQRPERTQIFGDFFRRHDLSTLGTLLPGHIFELRF